MTYYIAGVLSIGYLSRLFAHDVETLWKDQYHSVLYVNVQRISRHSRLVIQDKQRNKSKGQKTGMSQHA